MAPAEGQGASLLLWVEGAAVQLTSCLSLSSETKHSSEHNQSMLLVPRPQTQAPQRKICGLLRNPESKTTQAHTARLFSTLGLCQQEAASTL